MVVLSIHKFLALGADKCDKYTMSKQWNSDEYDADDVKIFGHYSQWSQILC